ncbi:hypothetical protein MKX01_026207 [Papaver californicum]|nr:hypothetical protein MKX01_026207 [Papaver californicum]
MFFLSLIEHTLRLPPHLLSLPLPEAIRGELEKLFVDKVIAQLGLCVSIYDIKYIDGGLIFAGDGASTYTVDFRLIMFHPFEGEILSGKVDASDANGLRLSVVFFKDIFVPAHLLPNPSKFSEDGRWTWMYGDVELTIEQDDEIRFRVHKISYPPIPFFWIGPIFWNNLLLQQFLYSSLFLSNFVLFNGGFQASIDFDGLGPISWWV